MTALDKAFIDEPKAKNLVSAATYWNRDPSAMPQDDKYKPVLLAGR